jgi:hypothetical protein
MSNQHICNIKEDPYARAKECTDALEGVKHPAEYIENILKSRDGTWLELCKLHEKHVKLEEQYAKLLKDYDDLRNDMENKDVD